MHTYHSGANGISDNRAHGFADATNTKPDIEPDAKSNAGADTKSDTIAHGKSDASGADGISDRRTHAFSDATSVQGDPLRGH